MGGGSVGDGAHPLPASAPPPMAAAAAASAGMGEPVAPPAVARPRSAVMRALTAKMATRAGGAARAITAATTTAASLSAGSPPSPVHPRDSAREAARAGAEYLASPAEWTPALSDEVHGRPVPCASVAAAATLAAADRLLPHGFTAEEYRVQADELRHTLLRAQRMAIGGGTGCYSGEGGDGGPAARRAARLQTPTLPPCWAPRCMPPWCAAVGLSVAASPTAATAPARRQTRAMRMP